MKSPPRRVGLFLALLLLLFGTTGRAQGTRPDTWAATDALERDLPMFSDVGKPRAHKFVGVFYFLWLGEHGTSGPFDITKILAKNPRAMDEPDSPLWGPMHAPHHWGEPLLGYYLSDDEWVLRRHAQMLSDAGVDTVIFDVTNGFTYKESYLALCRVWSQIRREGGRTPQIAFLAPFWNPDAVVRALYHDLYQPGRYSDLWFRWQGKPLIMADPNLVGRRPRDETFNEPSRLEPGRAQAQTFTTDRPLASVGGYFPTWSTADAAVTLTLRRGGPGGPVVARKRFSNVADNAVTALEFARPLPPGTYHLEQSAAAGSVGWWSRGSQRALSLGYPGDAPSSALRGFFTWRAPQPSYFTGPTAPAQWGWLDVFPQKPYHVTPGVAEQVTVGVAQNAVDGKLGALSSPQSRGRSFHDGKQPPPSGQDFTGRNFAEQWKRALALDPSFIFVTGWNEWIAGRFPADAPFAGAGPVTFVDQFNPEFSRDIEPMRGGHGDNYYYQLVANVRRYKGVRPPLSPSVPKTIRIDGDFADWKTVAPDYRDDVFDTVERSHRGWGSEGRYRDDTGRNDFTLLKVARDDTFVYFYARTRAPITPPAPDDTAWMTLFLRVVGSPIGGWEGYPFVVNRTRASETVAVLETSANGWAGKPVGRVSLRRNGNELELAVRRADLGLAPGRPFTLDFKWLDNTVRTGDLLDTYTHGDTAPNARFRYRYAGD